MKPDKWFEKTLKSFEKDPEFLLERKILDVTEEICAVMKKKDITRKELADRLDVSPAAITKILRGSSNFTLKTLLSLANALDLDLDVSFRERKKTSTASEVYRPHRQSNLVDAADSSFADVSGVSGSMATDVRVAGSQGSRAISFYDEIV